MSTINTHAGDIRLVGGRLCLDFVNTVDSHRRPEPKEYLRSYADLLLWARHAAALDAEAAATLAASAASAIERAERALASARALRRTLFTIFVGIGEGRPPGPHDLAPLNAALAAAPTRVGLRSEDGRVGWTWRDEAEELERPVWPVLWSAADLLTSADAGLIRECAGEGCSWLFLDTSRNRTRRWCSMEDCGNRAKARRHYARRGGAR